MKYLFEDVVFTPSEKVKMTVAGEPVHLENKPVQLLKFLLDNKGKPFTKEELTQAVWGVEKHTHSAVNTALSKIRKALPETINVEYHQHARAHVLNVEVERVAPRFKKLEDKLESSPKVWGLFIGIALIVLLLGFLTFEVVSQKLNPPAKFQVDNKEVGFTRNYFVNEPQLSPNQRYIALKLTRDVFKQDYLGLYDVKWDDVKPLVPIYFNDGFRWNLKGDKIVYQHRSAERCEVRLLSFNSDMTIKSNQLLRMCDFDGGTLSFAWFNEAEFYFNLATANATESANGLVQHHLYSFNINTLTTRHHANADYTNGVGFYSLEYDSATKALYALQTNGFKTTDFYRYQQGKLTHVATVDYLVRFYSAANNQLVIQTDEDRLMINHPADDFNGQKPLLTTSAEHISMPHHVGQQLIYVAGDLYHSAAYQWQAQRLEQIRLYGFAPEALADFNGDVVFSVERKGMYHIYLKKPYGEPIRLSQSQINLPIEQINIVDDLFVVNYRNKIVIYRYAKQQLHVVHTLDNYTNGILSADGSKLLVTQLKAKQQAAQVIELAVSNFQPTGLNIPDAQWARYEQQQVVYLSNNHELIRIVDGKNYLIASKVKATSLTASVFYQRRLYYINNSNSEPIITIDLATGEQEVIDIAVVDPLKLSVIHNKLTIMVRKSMTPKIILSTITQF